MKKKLLPLLTFTAIGFLYSFSAHAQLGINYHQSSLPFIGINFTIGEKFSPELRLGTDRYFEDVTIEAVVNYHYLRKEDYTLYVGLGINSGSWSPGAVIPVGAQF